MRNRAFQQPEMLCDILCSAFPAGSGRPVLCSRPAAFATPGYPRWLAWLGAAE